MCLPLLALAVSFDQIRLIVPLPNRTAEQLVDALAAHRYSGALNQIGQDLHMQMNPEDVRNLVQAVEDAQGSIEDAHQLGYQKQGASALAEVRITFANRREHALQFQLVRERGIWQVSSIEPLQALSQD